MTTILPSTDAQPEDGNLISKAFLRACALLELKQKDMASILGRSEPTISRLARNNLFLSPDGKDGEIALLFLRMYRSLDALLGGNEGNARAWFNAVNHGLNGSPRDLVKSLEGLIHVVDYLDAMRGPL